MPEETDTSTETGTEDTVTTGQAPEGEQTFDLEYVQKLRGEAAAARTAKKKAVEDARNEVAQEWKTKLDEQVSKTTEVEGQLGAAGIELTKLKMAIEQKVPTDRVLQFASILQGTDEDSIRESAESAVELFGGFKQQDRATDTTQGRGNKKEMALNGDPLFQAVVKAVGGTAAR